MIPNKKDDWEIIFKDNDIKSYVTSCDNTICDIRKRFINLYDSFTKDGNPKEPIKIQIKWELSKENDKKGKEVKIKKEYNKMEENENKRKEPNIKKEKVEEENIPIKKKRIIFLNRKVERKNFMEKRNKEELEEEIIGTNCLKNNDINNINNKNNDNNKPYQTVIDDFIKKPYKTQFNNKMNYNSIQSHSVNFDQLHFKKNNNSDNFNLKRGLSIQQTERRHKSLSNDENNINRVDPEKQTNRNFKNYIKVNNNAQNQYHNNRMLKEVNKRENFSSFKSQTPSKNKSKIKIPGKNQFIVNVFKNSSFKNSGKNSLIFKKGPYKRKRDYDYDDISESEKELHNKIRGKKENRLFKTDEALIENNKSNYKKYYDTSKQIFIFDIKGKSDENTGLIKAILDRKIPKETAFLLGYYVFEKKDKSLHTLVIFRFTSSGKISKNWINENTVFIERPKDNPDFENDIRIGIYKNEKLIKYKEWYGYKVEKSKKDADARAIYKHRKKRNKKADRGYYTSNQNNIKKENEGKKYRLKSYKKFVKKENEGSNQDRANCHNNNISKSKIRAEDSSKSKSKLKINNNFYKRFCPSN